MARSRKTAPEAPTRAPNERIPTFLLDDAPAADGGVLDLDAIPVEAVLGGAPEAVPAVIDDDEDGDAGDSVPPLPESRYDYAGLARADARLAADVRAAAREIRTIYARLRSDIAAIGARLLRAKAGLGHGRFQTWCLDEFGWPTSSVRHYMRVARGATRLETATVAALPVAAIALLANASDAIVEEVRQLVGNGQAVTLDIVRDLIADHRSKAVAAPPPPADVPDRPPPQNAETLRALADIHASAVLDEITRDARLRDLAAVVKRARAAIDLFGEQAARAARGDRVIKARITDSWRAGVDAVEGLERLTGTRPRSGARRAALPLADLRWAEVAEALDAFAHVMYGLTHHSDAISQREIDRVAPLAARIETGLASFAPADG